MILFHKDQCLLITYIGALHYVLRIQQCRQHGLPPVQNHMPKILFKIVPDIFVVLIRHICSLSLANSWWVRRVMIRAKWFYPYAVFFFFSTSQHWLPWLLLHKYLKSEVYLTGIVCKNSYRFKKSLIHFKWQCWPLYRLLGNNHNHIQKLLKHNLL